ncbi:MAG: SAM-dependent chlorinase/fluorinase, partial [Spirochaetaceae bacterium]|nr:SAM-dependent chlorinase/fluorinase [Spirochaetaceae bacterium]
MKKVLIRERVLGSVFLFVLAACAPTKAPEISYPDFSGEVVSVSKYGNVLTDINAAAFEAAGYETGDVLIIQSEGIAEEAPYVSAYSDVNRGNLLALTDQDSGQIELAISYGNLSERLGIVSGSAVILKLADKGAYRGEFEIR